MSFDPEQLCEEAAQQLELSLQCDPRENPWGMYAWGDAPAAIGGGMGAFQWFASRQQLLDFLCELSPSLYCCHDSEQDWRLQTQRLRQILTGLDADPEATLQAINQELRGLLQFDWIGRYQDLCSGGFAFARHLRQDFRAQAGEEEDPQTAEAAAAPLDLDAEGEEAWLEFLRLYGI